MSSEMEKPNDKKPPEDSSLKSPHPPAGKKPQGVPKGPVPPRGSSSMPRIPAPGKGPGVPMRPAISGNPQNPTPMSGAPIPPPNPMKPPVPPAVPGARPPMTHGSSVPPAGIPSKSPAAGQAFQSQMADAEANSDALESKIQELEKRLTEEREKVLMANLRAKEEEALSAKVETSIKEIQDKLRREKREQELDEAKRKAEARLAEMERRIAEEREAWVATLKNQLNQRDQVSHEMESHFATRLKDLEYRWAQEKAQLETGIREREAEVIRIKQEFALKSEQEKTFLEDRVRTVANEREKLDRELERLREKFQQEKDQFLFEKQRLKDELAKFETALNLAKQQSQFEIDSLKKQMADLERQAEVRNKELSDKETQIELQKNQVSSLQNEAASFQNQVAEKGRIIETIRTELFDENKRANELEIKLDKLEESYKTTDRELEEIRHKLSLKETEMEDRVKKVRSADEDLLNANQKKIASLQEELEIARQAQLAMEKESGERRLKFEADIDRLTRELNVARADTKNEISRVQTDAETRNRTLQNRLDWYDSNANREYNLARDKVRQELEQAQEKAKKFDELDEQFKKKEAYSKQMESDLQRIQIDWDQTQRETQERIKGVQAELEEKKKTIAELEETKTAVDQDLKRQTKAWEVTQATLEKKEKEMERIRIELDSTHAKIANMQKHVEEYKGMLEGTDTKTISDLKREVAEKESELQNARMKIQDLKGLEREVSHGEDLMKEKERVFKQLLNDKDETINQFKIKAHSLEKGVEELANENEMIRNETKKKLDKILQLKQQEMEERLYLQKNEFSKEQRAGVEKVRKEFEEKMEAMKKEADAQIGKLKESSQHELEQLRSQQGQPVDTAEIESRLRQQMESHLLDQMREKETQTEEKIKELNEGNKKEADKLKWESENLKEELKRAREARLQIEREAQELLQKAEDHYKNEFDKKISEMGAEAQRHKGIFTALGKFLDTPIIDTTKKRREKEDGGEKAA